MDPYLEDPIGWPDVHLRLIASLADELAPGVEPDYFLRVEERVYVTDPEKDKGYAKLVPDVIVTTLPHPAPAVPELAFAGGPAATTATLTPPALVEGLLDPEIHDRYLVVHDKRSHDVVTAIEILSPANKVKGSRGRHALEEKRKLLRRGGAHWMEIDLLREGWRNELIAGRSDYCVTLLREGQPGILAWFIDLRDRLPTVAVPLRAPHPDVLLNVQRVLDAAYDRARYAHSVDYTRPIPLPSLKPADEAWVGRQVAARVRSRSHAAP